MTNSRNVIKRPLVTEKTITTQDNNNTVVFEVTKDANKINVKQAVEDIWAVKVDRVNIVNVKPKPKRMGRYEGMTRHVKKAYVKLAKGHKIDILKDK